MKHHALVRAAWRPLAALLTQCAALPASHAALEEACELEIPASPMETSLLEIARRCNVVVSFRPALMNGRTAPALSGRFTARQAFDLATHASGLQVEVTPGGTVTVVAAAAAPPPAVPAPAPAPAAPAGTAPEATLPQVVVTGSAQSRGLRGLRSWSATRTDTPLAELPQAVSVLTSDALSLQGGRTVTDAAAFVPGMVTSLEAGSGVDNFGNTGLSVPTLMVRGMPAAYALSGLRMVRGGLAPDNVFLERIEVPKGPSGVIDGVADWRGRGGLVNLVLKEAQDFEHTHVSQSLSSRDSGTLRLSADLGRPWSDRAAWRLVGYASQSGRTAGGYDSSGSAGLMGSGTVRLGAVTGTLTLQSERHRDPPAPAAQGGREKVDGVDADLPAQRRARVPADAGDRQLFTANVARLHLRWALSPQWSLVGSSMAESFQDDMRRHQPFTAPQLQTSRSLSVGTQWGLVGTITDGVVNHRVLLGLDASRWRSVTHGVNILDGGGQLKVDIRESKTALLLQDELSAGPLRLRGAVQYARTPMRDETRQRLDTGAFDPARHYLPVATTNWDAGLLYQLRPTLAVYVGAQQSTEANRVLPGQQASGDSEGLPDGSPIPSTVTRQVQAGLKLGTADRRLAGSMEIFRIRQSNFKLFTTLGYIQPRGRDSDGLEFELSGRPVPRVDLSLGLTYLRTLDRADTEGERDEFAAQVPRRSVYLLSRIRLGDLLGTDNHLGVAFHAASATRVGLPYYTQPVRLDLPGGGQLDLSWDAVFGAWSMKAALANVFDQRLFGASADTRFIPLQPGRSISLTASYIP